MVAKAHLFKRTFLASKERKLRTQALFFRRREYHAGLCRLVLCSFMPDAISAKSPASRRSLSIIWYMVSKARLFAISYHESVGSCILANFGVAAVSRKKLPKYSF
ncbi:hypothetical protein KSP39_PZI003534 [Platanthera zijinensis]|uniref:Uncharacterized protein n=1 Tax=Platanthera zijinensis TaxID=2320716 RepID=A0AAP0BWG7_9ASPA